MNDDYYNERTVESNVSSQSRLQPKNTFSDSELDAAEEVLESKQDAVTVVYAASGTGTGYQIDDGLYATVDHIFGLVFDFNYPQIQTYSGDYYTASRGESAEIDLHTVGSDHAVEKSIETNRKPNLSEGDVLIAIGHPLNVGKWVGSVGRYQKLADGDDKRFIADIPTQNGNSGSPVFDLDGNFVGMTTHAIEDDDPQLDRPSDPRTHFHGYDPASLIIPAKIVHKSITGLRNSD